MQIFLIDDEEIFNYLNKVVIRHTDESVEVKAFVSGEELMNYFNEHRKNLTYPDIMFIDIRMPGIEGFDLLQVLSKEEPGLIEHTKIYMLSSTLDERDLKKARQYPFVKDCICKPLTTEILQGILVG